MIIQGMTDNSAQQLGLTRLSHLGLIRAEGADAVSFLQGQLTQDFALLPANQARLAAFCSAKGRMQASFVGFKRSDTDILLLCSRELLAATLKRLSMFVLRSKVKLTDATAAFDAYGLAGAAALDTVAGTPAGAAQLPPWHRLEAAGGWLVALYPALGQPRALWLAPTGTPAPAVAASTLTEAGWAWLEVHSAVATITPPIVDAFVPQMLNYESVGGVNFKKGCYPGQEVVARSQFRGTLKRRAYVVLCDAPLAAGDEVFQAADAEQPCGTVAQAAQAPDGTGGHAAIVSMQIAAAQAGGLHLRAAGGPGLRLQPLPYELLADI
jgi:folate-binding protein YgfZ